MSYVLEQFGSLDEACQHITTSRKKDGSWTKLAHNRSIDRESGDWGGVTLDELLPAITTLTLHDLQARIARIEGLAHDLEGALPPGETVRRLPVWSAQGSRVSVHRVLRGDLAHAWRTTRRHTTPLPGWGRIVLVVPAIVSAGVSTERILWSASATLALAAHYRSQGRPVELWSLGWHERVFDSYKHYLWMIPLQAPGEQWQSQVAALATYNEWSRRLGFRLLEMASRTQGKFYAGYGYGVADNATILAWLRTVWAPAQGLPPECLHLGATEHARIRNEDTARAWLTQQLPNTEAA